MNQTYIKLAKLGVHRILCVMLRNTILWIIWYSELTNFELSRWSCTPELLQYAFIPWLKWIYINNFINNILIKTINNDTSKQYAETAVLVHAIIGNGNTLINSQPSSDRIWVLSLSHVTNLSCHQQMATLHFITDYTHNTE